MIQCKLIADLEKFGIPDQPWITLIGSHAGWININNFLHMRQFVSGFEQLIHLLLILNNHDGRMYAVNGKNQLFSDRRREKIERGGAQSMRCQFTEKPFR